MIGADAARELIAIEILQADIDQRDLGDLPAQGFNRRGAILCRRTR